MKTWDLMSRAILVAGVSLALVLLCASPRPAMAYTAWASGYRVIDSEEIGGPIYTWDDISTTGTLVDLANTDDGQVTVPIPFSNPLWSFGFLQSPYYSSVSICTNGFLQFGGATDVTASNAAMPGSAAPNNIIAALWDDLIYSPGQSQVRCQALTSPTRFVVLWQDWLVQVGTETVPVTFQVALYPALTVQAQQSAIRIQYAAAADSGCTVGIEDSTGTNGLQYLYSGSPAGNSLYPGLAIGFLPSGAVPPWPTAPWPTSNLVQSDDPGSAAESAGFIDTDGNVSFRAWVAGATSVQLQVEVKPPDSEFDGTGLQLGNLVPGSGGTSEVTVSGLGVGSDPVVSYKWRARTIAGEVTSEWVGFGNDWLDPWEVDFFVIIATGGEPQAPTTLVQSDNPSGPAELAGFIDTDGSVSVRAWVSHSNPATSVQVQIEVKPAAGVFDGTGLLLGDFVPGSGGTSEATATGLADGDYKWRARTVALDLASAWVNFGLESGTDFTVLTSGGPGAPLAPTTLVQSDSPLGPAELAGFVDTDGNVSVRASVSHSNPSTSVQVQVEAKPAASAFDETGLLLGNVVPGSGGTSEVTATGLTGGDYKWRARTVAGDQVTAWTNFGPESGTDFTVDLSAPPPPPPPPPEGGGGGGDSDGKKKGGFCGGGASGSGHTLWFACALMAALCCVSRLRF